MSSVWLTPQLSMRSVRLSVKQCLLMGSLLSALAPAALAAEKNPSAAPDVRPQIQKLKEAYTAFQNSGRTVRINHLRSESPLSAAAVNVADAEIHCGDVITQSVRVINDLQCPSTTGFALGIKGDNITVDGNHHFISAPIAQSGIFIQGSAVAVKNFIVHGVSSGAAILSYDVPTLDIGFNDISFNQTGVLIYAEKNAVNAVNVHDNLARGNSLFGIRTTQDSPGTITAPIIQHNNLSLAGSFGLYLQAIQAALNFTDQNSYLDSVNGIYLKSGSFTVSGLTFTNSRIQKRAIFVDSASSLIVTALDTTTAQLPASTQERVGLELYKVVTFTINSLFTNQNDVGVKIATEGGVATTGTLAASTFQNNTTAGIQVTSYDQTAFGGMSLSSNIFLLPDGVPAILTSPGTVWTQP